MITKNALNADHKNGKTSISDLSVEFTIVPIWLCFSDICLIDFPENGKSTITFFANCIWMLSSSDPLAAPPSPTMWVPNPHDCWVWLDVDVERSFKMLIFFFFTHLSLVSFCVWVCLCACLKRIWVASYFNSADTWISKCFILKTRT